MHPETSSPTGSPAWYLAAMAIFKNEAPYLDEWLAFCVAEGIEHILLYDNDSTDNCREVLQPWIEAGIVELFDWPTPYKNKAQVKAFEDALRRLRGRARWVAFIDIDEYLFSPTGKTVAEMLRRYEAHAGVVVNWQCYGTSGHKTRPAGLTIESFTRRARTDWARNKRVKTIVDPLLAIEPLGTHFFRVQPGHALVTEDFKPVHVVHRRKWLRRGMRHLAARLPYLPLDPYPARQASAKQVSVSQLRINHYVTRSEAELLLKFKDRHHMSDRDRRSHSRYHDRNEVEDPILASRAARVREIVARVREAAVAPVARAHAYPVRSSSASTSLVQDAVHGSTGEPCAPPVARVWTALGGAVASWARRIRRDLVVLWLAARDRRVPWYAKAVAGVVGAYPLWPIDLIPDVVPVIGYADDLVIVPLGVVLAARLIPAPLLADLRQRADAI
jgi:uncharacterized membrane protein YkvA (DUF1232 family)